MFSFTKFRRLVFQFCIATTAILNSIVFTSAQVCNPNPPSPYTTTPTDVTCSSGTYNGKIGAPEGAGLQPTASPSPALKALYSNSNVTIQSGSVIDAGNSSAISLYDNALINVYGTVQNTSTGGTGSYGTGANTVEFNSGGTLNVYLGGSIIAKGTGASANNAEAVNVQGTSGTNNINNWGTIGTNNNATKAIWNQAGSKLIIDNYGTIYSGNQNVNNTNGVIGGSNGGVTITNENGASIYGSLTFGGSANDTVILYTGSFLSGTIDGGSSSSNDKLYLVGDGAQTLTNDISNMNYLYKQGSGTWTWSGTNTAGDHTFVSTEIQQGTLSVTGNLSSTSTIINNGGTLAGTGTVTSSSGVTNNGTIAPGLANSSGNLAIAGNLTNKALLAVTILAPT